MDQVDQQIVALLRENARRSFQDIGGRVSLSAPAVKRRVDRLEREGVIRGYSAAIDPSVFGWHAHAFVELFCEGRMSGAEVREAVAAHPVVEGAYTIAGAPSAVTGSPSTMVMAERRKVSHAPSRSWSCSRQTVPNWKT